MLRNLNRQYAGRRVLDIGKTGVLGSTVPGSGSNGASYLYQDVIDNSWQASEVRGRITATNLPAGSWYAWNDGGFQINSGTPDGTYTVSYERFVFGVPQVNPGNITFYVGIGAGTVSAAISISDTIFSGTTIGSGGIINSSLVLDNVSISSLVTGAVGTVSSSITLANVTTSLSLSGQIDSIASFNVVLDNTSPAVYAVSYFPSVNAAISLDNTVFFGSVGGSNIDPTTLVLDDVGTDMSASGTFINNVLGENVFMPIPLGITLEGKLIIMI